MSLYKICVVRTPIGQDFVPNLVYLQDEGHKRLLFVEKTRPLPANYGLPQVCLSYISLLDSRHKGYSLANLKPWVETKYWCNYFNTLN